MLLYNFHLIVSWDEESYIWQVFCNRALHLNSHFFYFSGYTFVYPSWKITRRRELTADSICAAFFSIFLQKLKQISPIGDSKLLETENAVNPMYAIKYTMVTAKNAYVEIFWKI